MAAEEMQQDGTDEADECEQRMHGAKAAQRHLLHHVAQDARRPAAERVIDPLERVGGAAEDLEEQSAHDPGLPLERPDCGAGEGRHDLLWWPVSELLERSDDGL